MVVTQGRAVACGAFVIAHSMADTPDRACQMNYTTDLLVSRLVGGDPSQQLAHPHSQGERQNFPAWAQPYGPRL